MRRFAEFLAESGLDLELDGSRKEIFSVDLSGGRLVREGFEDEGSGEEDVFGEIAAASVPEDPSPKGDSGEGPEDGGRGRPAPGWGGEIYASLDFPQLEDALEKVSEEEEREEPEGTETLRGLLGRKGKMGSGDGETRGSARRRNERYEVSGDGTGILRRNPESGKLERLSGGQAREIVLRKARGKGEKNVGYAFDGNGEIVVRKVGEDGTSEGRVLGRYRKNFLKRLNDAARADGLHYRYDGDSWRLLVNSTPWTRPGEEEDFRDKDRFDRAEYRPVETGAEKEKVLSILNSGKKGRKNPWETLEYGNGRFFLNGRPMDREGLERLAVSLNGNVGGDTVLPNPGGWGRKTAPYWDSYKISVAGSKIGDAVNFNLPPVVTCADGVPCAKEGCYALKAYARYPSARSAMDCNLALLRRDSGFRLFVKSLVLALDTPARGSGKKFSLCRIHVDGDLGIGDEGLGKEYLGAIC